MAWATTRDKAESISQNGDARIVEETEAPRFEFADDPAFSQTIDTANAAEDTVNVADVMGEAQPAPPEFLSGTVEGEGTDTPLKQKRGRKPKDPLAEMLKQFKFGQMAVMIHTLMYRAVNTPEHPCADLSPEEAEMIDSAVVAYARHRIEINPTAGPMVPLMAVVIANLIPLLNRAPAIVPATVPIVARVGAWFSNAVGWVRSKFTRQETEA